MKENFQIPSGIVIIFIIVFFNFLSFHRCVLQCVQLTGERRDSLNNLGRSPFVSLRASSPFGGVARSRSRRLGLSRLALLAINAGGACQQANHLSELDSQSKTHLHGSVGPQIGEVTCGGSPHLSRKRDQIEMRDNKDRWVTPP